MCSPTRAALLTGRNHHRVGNGQIAELANDWDGYAGTIPKSSATAAEVLKNYGYSTVGFGKWHNTPAEQTTAAGPFDYWPTGYGFEYFYGFLAGEASQYEPNLVRNTTVVHPPTTPEQGYHLTEDLADDAIGWLRQHKAFEPDKPFFMYWASGAIHGPHHVMKEWADKYKGKFDDGWDKYRERVFAARQGKGLDSRRRAAHAAARDLASWDSIPEDEKPFQRRLMEVSAGFAEHADHQVGRLVDEVEKLGYGDNTLIFYIWGDNGSSAEGQNGTISELLAQNGIPDHRSSSTSRRSIALGGLDVLGSPKTDNHVPRRLGLGRQHPVQGDQARRLALRRHAQPDGRPLAGEDQARRDAALAVPPRQRHRPDHLRGRRHHAAAGGQRHPAGPDRRRQLRLHLRRRRRPRAGKRTQYFEIMGSRAIYHDGWMASRLRPAHPVGARACRQASASGRPTRTSGSSTTSTRTGRQANDLAARCRRSSRR